MAMKSVGKGLLVAMVVLLVTAWFFAALGGLRRGNAREEKQALERALHRGAAACYAAEGYYPPDLDYLQENYGVKVDESKYIVIYEVQGQNLMPQITVIERK